jgi:two-component system response regulator DesR
MSCIPSRAKRPGAEPPESCIEPKPAEPVRVLIVDEDARVRAALRAAISLEQDLEVLGQAAGAPAALAIASDAAPFVALVDIMVRSDGSGLALVQLLSQVPGCRVVAMSLRGGFQAAAHAAGAVAFVEKGDDVDSMLSAIRAVAARHA